MVSNIADVINGIVDGKVEVPNEVLLHLFRVVFKNYLINLGVAAQFAAIVGDMMYADEGSLDEDYFNNVIREHTAAMQLLKCSTRVELNAVTEYCITRSSEVKNILEFGSSLASETIQ